LRRRVRAIALAATPPRPEQFFTAKTQRAQREQIVKNIREETEPITEVVVGAVFKVHRASRPTAGIGFVDFLRALCVLAVKLSLRRPSS
jgi:hypothetical protein